MTRHIGLVHVAFDYTHSGPDLAAARTDPACSTVVANIGLVRNFLVHSDLAYIDCGSTVPEYIRCSSSMHH